EIVFNHCKRIGGLVRASTLSPILPSRSWPARDRGCNHWLLPGRRRCNLAGRSPVVEGSDLAPELAPLLALAGRQLAQRLLLADPRQVRVPQPVLHPFTDRLLAGGPISERRGALRGEGGGCQEQRTLPWR